MSKKEDEDDIELNLDDDDIDFDFGDDDMDFDFGNENANKKDRKPQEVLKDGFKDGFKSQYDPQELEKVADKVLPENFVNAKDELKNYVDSSISLYEDSRQELSKEINKVKVTVGKVLPVYEKMMPGPIKDLLQKFADSKEEDYSKQRVSEEQQQQEMLQGEISKLAEAQIEMQKQSEAQQMLRDKMDSKRFESQQDLLYAIRGGISRVYNYNEQVATKYYQKSIEIGYLQLYTQRAIKDMVFKSAEHSKAALDAIVKNTALPEFVKQQNSERMKEFGIRRLMEFSSNKISEFTSGYREKVFKNLQDYAKGAIEGVRTGVDMTTGMVEQMADMQQMMRDMGEEPKSLTEHAGIQAGKTAANFLNTKIMSKLVSMFDRSGQLTAGGNLAAHTFDHIAEKLNRYKNSTEDKGWFGNFISTLLPDSSENELSHSLGSRTKLKELAEFDVATRKSIVDIIPALLSKIHQSTEGIRSRIAPGQELDDNTLLEWDHDTATLQQRKVLDASLMERANAAANIKSQLNYATNIAHLIDKDGKLPDDVFKLFVKEIVHTLGKHQGFNAVEFINHKWTEKIDDGSKLVINNMIAEVFEFDQGGFSKIKSEFTDRYIKIQENYRSAEQQRGYLQDMLARESAASDTDIARHARLNLATMNKGIYTTGGKKFTNTERMDKELSTWDITEKRTRLYDDEKRDKAVNIDYYTFREMKGFENESGDPRDATILNPRPDKFMKGKKRITYDEWVKYQEEFYFQDKEEAERKEKGTTLIDNVVKYGGMAVDKAGEFALGKERYEGYKETGSRYIQETKSAISKGVDKVGSTIGLDNLSDLGTASILKANEYLAKLSHRWHWDILNEDDTMIDDSKLEKKPDIKYIVDRERKVKSEEELIAWIIENRDKGANIQYLYERFSNDELERLGRARERVENSLATAKVKLSEAKDRTVTALQEAKEEATKIVTDKDHRKKRINELSTLATEKREILKERYSEFRTKFDNLSEEAINDIKRISDEYDKLEAREEKIAFIKRELKQKRNKTKKAVTGFLSELKEKVDETEAAKRVKAVVEDVKQSETGQRVIAESVKIKSKIEEKKQQILNNDTVKKLVEEGKLTREEVEAVVNDKTLPFKQKVEKLGNVAKAKAVDVKDSVVDKVNTIIDNNETLTSAKTAISEISDKVVNEAKEVSDTVKERLVETGLISEDHLPQKKATQVDVQNIIASNTQRNQRRHGRRHTPVINDGRDATRHRRRRGGVKTDYYFRDTGIDNKIDDEPIVEAESPPQTAMEEIMSGKQGPMSYSKSALSILLSKYNNGKELTSTEKYALAKAGMLPSTVDPQISKVATGIVEKAQDVYVAGETTPRLLKDKLQTGEYFLADSGKVIYSPDEITEPVKDRDGNMVITPSDLKLGLVNAKGDTLGPGDIWDAYSRRFLSTLKSANSASKVGKLMMRVLSKPLRLTMDTTDIYLPGDPPMLVMSRWGMMTFQYRNEDGSFITSVREIKGNIYDKNGDIIVTAEQVKAGLVDKFGKPIRGYFIRRMRTAGRWLKATYKGAKWLANKSGLTSLAKGAAGAFGEGAKMGYRTMFGGPEGTEGYIKRRGKVAGKMLDATLGEYVARPVGKQIGKLGKSIGKKVGKQIDKINPFTGKQNRTHGGRVETDEGIVVDPRTGKARANNYRDEMKRQDEVTKLREEESRKRIEKENKQREERKKKNDGGILGLLKKYFPLIAGVVGAGLTALTTGLDNIWDVLKGIGAGFAAYKAFRMGQAVADAVGGMVNMAKGVGRGVMGAGKFIGNIAGKVVGGVHNVAKVGVDKVTKKVAGKALFAETTKQAALKFATGTGAKAVAGRVAVGAFAVLGPIGLALGAAYTLYEIGSFVWDLFQQPNKVDDFRAAAYGVHPDSEYRVNVVLEFEKLIYKHSKVTNRGTVELPNIERLSKDKEFTKIIGAFAGGQEGLSKLQSGEVDTAQYGKNFNTWYNQRFVPVFTQHVMSLHQIDSHVDYTKAFGRWGTGDLEDGLVYPWARRAYFKADDPENPYGVLTDPFFFVSGEDSQNPMLADQDVVDEYYNIVKKAYEKDESDLRKENKTKLEESKKHATGYVDKFAFEKTSERYSRENAKNMGGFESAYDKAVRQDVINKDGTKADTYISGNAVYVVGDISKIDLDGRGVIKDYDAIRVRMYGINTLVENRVRALLSIERYMLQYVKFNSDGKCDFTKFDFDQVVKLYGTMLGWDSSNPNDYAMFKSWFEKRFTPVFLAFAGAMYVQTGSKDIFNKLKALNPKIVFEIFISLIAIKVKMDSGEVSIWDVPFSPVKGLEPNKSSGTVTENMINLEQERDENILTEKTPDKSKPTEKDSGADQTAKSPINVTQTALATAMGAANMATGGKAGEQAGKATGTNADYSLGGGPVYDSSKIKSTPKKEALAKAIMNAMGKTGWSETEINHFLAQVTHESDHLKATEEYASGSAYEGRKDLGNTQPGDGVRFKGRGVIQLTGRANYQKLANKLNRQDIMSNPSIVASDPALAVESAILWWEDRKSWDKNFRKAVTDPNDVKGVTKGVNGGDRGLNDRIAKYNEYKSGKGLIRRLAGEKGTAVSEAVDKAANGFGGGQTAGAGAGGSWDETTNPDGTRKDWREQAKDRLKAKGEIAKQHGGSVEMSGGKVINYALSDEQLKHTDSNGDYTNTEMATNSMSGGDKTVGKEWTPPVAPKTFTKENNVVVSNNPLEQEANKSKGTMDRGDLKRKDVTFTGDDSLKGMLARATPELVETGKKNLKLNYSNDLGKYPDPSMMNQTYMKLFYAMIGDYVSKNGGGSFGTNQMLRTYEDQVKMKQKHGKKAATPGRSNHGWGIAIDLNNSHGPGQSLTDKLFNSGIPAKWGFHRPLLKSMGEWWHIENKHIGKPKGKKNGDNMGDVGLNQISNSKPEANNDKDIADNAKQQSLSGPDKALEKAANETTFTTRGDRLREEAKEKLRKKGEIAKQHGGSVTLQGGVAVSNVSSTPTPSKDPLAGITGPAPSSISDIMPTTSQQASTSNAMVNQEVNSEVTSPRAPVSGEDRHTLVAEAQQQKVIDEQKKMSETLVNVLKESLDVQKLTSTNIQKLLDFITKEGLGKETAPQPTAPAPMPLFNKKSEKTDKSSPVPSALVNMGVGTRVI